MFSSSLSVSFLSYTLTSFPYLVPSIPNESLFSQRLYTVTFDPAFLGSLAFYIRFLAVSRQPWANTCRAIYKVQGIQEASSFNFGSVSLYHPLWSFQITISLRLTLATANSKLNRHQEEWPAASKKSVYTPS